MKTQHAVTSQNGFTLLEAVIAVFVLTIGIMAAALMQGQAMKASRVAFNRSEANSFATALMETFQSLPFDSAQLTKTGNAVSGVIQGSLKNSPDNPAVHTYTLGRSGMKNMDKQIKAVSGGKVTDLSDITYTLSWAVEDVMSSDNEQIAQVMAKNIRIYMSWETPVGTNSLEYTCTKCKNKEFVQE